MNSVSIDFTLSYVRWHVDYVADVFFFADTDHTHQVSVCALYVLYNVENEDGDGLIHVNDHNIQMVKSDV